MFFWRALRDTINVLFDREATSTQSQQWEVFPRIPLFRNNLIGQNTTGPLRETKLSLGCSVCHRRFQGSHFDRNSFYQPNYTEFPMLNLSFNTRVVDKHGGGF